MFVVAGNMKHGSMKIVRDSKIINDLHVIIIDIVLNGCNLADFSICYTCTWTTLC